MHITGSAYFFLGNSVRAIKLSVEEYLKSYAHIVFADNTFLVRFDETFIAIDVGHLSVSTDTLDALYMERIISEVKSLYPGRVLFIFVCVYASLSAIKKALALDNVLICVVSLRKCVGIEKSEFIDFIQRIGFSFDNDLVNMFKDNTIFGLFSKLLMFVIFIAFMPHIDVIAV